MNLSQLWKEGTQWVIRVLQDMEARLKAWTKPAPDRLISGVATDLRRSKKRLIVENAFLRQQVIVLKRQNRRRQLTMKDRCLLVVLASLLRGWKDALLIVQPNALLKWHRQGFRLFWRRKSQAKPSKPRIAAETIALILEMATNNRLWGAPRIRDKLLKLGIRVSKRTIQKYMRQARRGLPPQQKSQTWATFRAAVPIYRRG